MRHQILYQPSYSLAVVQLERGEQIVTESGAMVSMSPTLKLEAKMSGGGDGNFPCRFARSETSALIAMLLLPSAAT